MSVFQFSIGFLFFDVSAPFVLSDFWTQKAAVPILEAPAPTNHSNLVVVPL